MRRALDDAKRAAHRGRADPLHARALIGITLRDEQPVDVAAESIGLIGDHDAIGPLIGALVTKHKVKEGSGPSDQHTYVFTPSGGTAMNMGSSGAKLVTHEVDNAAVLAALTKLSGVNFGFDQPAWRAWLSSEAKAHPVDVRRDQ